MNLPHGAKTTLSHVKYEQLYLIISYKISLFLIILLKTFYLVKYIIRKSTPSACNGVKHIIVKSNEQKYSICQKCKNNNLRLNLYVFE